MTTRPSITLSSDQGSIDCLIFKVSESLSEWESTPGVYIYARLNQNDASKYLEIIFIGCTVDFSFIQYTASKTIFEHKPSHILFFEKKNNADIHSVAKALCHTYQPILSNARLLKYKL